jgi:hypothetical protein
LTIARWRKGDYDIEGEGKTFEDWTVLWWQWSHSMPNNGPVNDHPLRTNGSRAYVGQPSRLSSCHRPVWFCGGYWETAEAEVRRSFTLPPTKRDCSLLFAVLVTGIAEDEFGPPFLPSEPKPFEKIEAAYSTITDPSTTANFTITGPDTTERYHKCDLDLITPNKLVRIWPSKGFEINGKSGFVDLGTAGYWCFLKGPLKVGEYQFVLDCDCPMFGHYSGEKLSNRFRLYLRYDISVPQEV